MLRRGLVESVNALLLTVAFATLLLGIPNGSFSLCFASETGTSHFLLVLHLSIWIFI